MSLQVAHDPMAYCTMCRQFTYPLVWRPERHYVPGTQIEVRSHCLRAFLSWHYAKMTIEAGDITFRWKVAPTPSEMWHNRERVILRARLQYGARRGQPVLITMTVIPPTWAGIDNLLSLWTIDVPNNFQPDAPPPEPVRERGSDCTLAVSAGPVERLSIYSRPMPGLDGQVRTCLVPADRFGNPSAFESPVPAQLGWNGAGWTEELQGPCILALDPPRHVGRLTVAVPMERLGLRENVANAVRQDGDLVVTGNPVWPEGPDGLRPAFGEFHWHTDFSGDGQRPIEEALRCARDLLNMDYVAPGDHNPRGEAWRRTVEALEGFNEDDAFATFFGWENGSDRGHENYYFVDPDHPLVCDGAAGIRGGRPDTLVDKLTVIHQQQPFIAIPHHTNSVAETRKIEDDSPYWHPYPWGLPTEYIPLVEIFQVRGNQERDVYDDVWRGWHQNNGASAQEALRLGYKVGFTGGTDNHCGWPGRAFAECEGMGMHPPSSVILTGLWTVRIERQAVYDSLKERHTWAVWDTRALVYYTVNGVLSGGELAVRKGAALRAHIRLSAEDALQSVEIVSEGRVCWSHSCADLDLDIEVPLGVAEKPTHFYLRALQRDGGIIYASPVFVTLEPESQSSERGGSQ